jgi:hypothetical protein
MSAVVKEIIYIKFQFMVQVEVVAEIIFAKIDRRGDIHVVVSKIDKSNNFVVGERVDLFESIFKGERTGKKLCGIHISTVRLCLGRKAPENNVFTAVGYISAVI